MQELRNFSEVQVRAEMQVRTWEDVALWQEGGKQALLNNRLRQLLLRRGLRIRHTMSFPAR